jgi:predicted nucleotidyltransferase
LFVRLPELKHRYIVDLIPFGKIETTQDTIAWPPDMSFIMNVTGFADALAASLAVTVSPGLTIQVASLPAIAMLKIFAWSDRGQENPKDATDFTLLLRAYHEAGNSERIYEEAIATLEAVGYDIELAGAWLLGRDSAAIASPETAAKLTGLLEGNTRSRLVEDMAKAMRGKDDAMDHSARLLAQFTQGFNAHR